MEKHFQKLLNLVKYKNKYTNDFDQRMNGKLRFVLFYMSFFSLFVPVTDQEKLTNYWSIFKPPFFSILAVVGLIHKVPFVIFISLNVILVWVLLSAVSI